MVWWIFPVPFYPCHNEGLLNGAVFSVCIVPTAVSYSKNSEKQWPHNFQTNKTNPNLFSYSSGREVIKNWVKFVICCLFLQKNLFALLLIVHSMFFKYFFPCITNIFFREHMGLSWVFCCVVIVSCLCRSHCSVPALRQCLEELASRWTSVASSLQLLSSDGSKQYIHKQTIHASEDSRGLVRQWLYWYLLLLKAVLLLIFRSEHFNSCILIFKNKA